MIKNLRILFMLLLILAMPVQAELLLYHVADRFEGVYPTSPEVTGTFATGAYESTAVQATDEENLIVYKGGYTNRQLMVPDASIPEFMDNFVDAHAKALSARVISRTHDVVDGMDMTRYTLEYSLQGVPARSFYIAGHRNNRLTFWGVQELPGMSTQDASFIFEIYSGYFKPL